MHQLSDIIFEATSRIDGMYMRLPVDGGEAQLRERVYCYELYHQLRCLWPHGCEYALNGEVDKRGTRYSRRLRAPVRFPICLFTRRATCTAITRLSK